MLGGRCPRGQGDLRMRGAAGSSSGGGGKDTPEHCGTGVSCQLLGGLQCSPARRFRGLDALAAGWQQAQASVGAVSTCKCPHDADLSVMRLHSRAGRPCPGPLNKHPGNTRERLAACWYTCWPVPSGTGTCHQRQPEQLRSAPDLPAGLTDGGRS